MNEPRWERIGMVARWQPVHLGHTPVLKALCEQAQTALIGIGSADSHDLRNPFSLSERTSMITTVLAPFANYRLLAIPDLPSDDDWISHIRASFGILDLFLTDNPYVATLLQPYYKVARPVTLLPPDVRVPLDATMVRLAMARGEDWQSMVPPEVADYLEREQLVTRFRNEFGLQTLAQHWMVL